MLIHGPDNFNSFQFMRVNIQFELKFILLLRLCVHSVLRVAVVVIVIVVAILHDVASKMIVSELHVTHHWIVG
jgi:hypothetical protein